MPTTNFLLSLSPYVYRCVYTYIYIYIIYIYMHTYRKYIHTYIDTYIHTYIPSHMCTHICTYILACIHTFQTSSEQDAAHRSSWSRAATLDATCRSEAFGRRPCTSLLWEGVIYLACGWAWAVPASRQCTPQWKLVEHTTGWWTAQSLSLRLYAYAGKVGTSYMILLMLLQKKWRIMTRWLSLDQIVLN